MERLNIHCCRLACKGNWRRHGVHRYACRMGRATDDLRTMVGLVGEHHPLYWRIPLGNTYSECRW